MYYAKLYHVNRSSYMHDTAELHNFRLITHFCSYSFYLFIYFFIDFVQMSLKFQKKNLPQ